MAIAYDASSSDDIINSSNTSITWSHTCTGTNKMLLTAFFSFDSTGGSKVSSMTYAGDAMTELTEVAIQSNLVTSMWSLIAPDSGSNNIVANFSAQTYIWVAATSYTGVLQSGFPDSSSSGATTSTVISGTTTTSADNCWAVMAAFHSNAGASLSSGTGTVLRVTSPTEQRAAMADGNGAVTPAGSVTLNVNCSNDKISHIIASIAPAAEEAITDNAVLFGINF